MPVIRPVTIAELFDAPNFAELRAEYEAESLRNPDMIGAPPNRAGYEQMERAGLLRPLGAFDGDRLVGFCVVLISPVLHFAGKVLATTESIFLSKGCRRNGAGIALISAAEDAAEEAGAKGLYITAPTDSSLSRVLPRLGYGQTNAVFYSGSLA